MVKISDDDKKEDWEKIPEGKIYEVEEKSNEMDRVNEIRKTQPIGDASKDGTGGM